jgi:hypothetical protein
MSSRLSDPWGPKSALLGVDFIDRFPPVAVNKANKIKQYPKTVDRHTCTDYYGAGIFMLSFGDLFVPPHVIWF